MRRLLFWFVFATVLIGSPAPNAIGEAASPSVVQGIVIDVAGKPVVGASVRVKGAGGDGGEAKTDDAGMFQLPGVAAGSYQISAQKAQEKSHPQTIVVGPGASRTKIRLLLENTGGNTNAGIEFSDDPKFTVAGVTDWTAVGGHGSDSILRTSEDLAQETQALQRNGSIDPDGKENPAEEARLRTALAGAPGSAKANHDLGAYDLHAARYADAVSLLLAAYRLNPQDLNNEIDLARAYEKSGDPVHAREHVNKLLAHGESADLHRLSGEIDEQAGDSLAAVHEFEQAVRLDPNEANYFAWGSELLVHRAVWQAAEVFRKGSAAYPASARMLAALGAAQFSGALYEEAARSVCRASDLSATDTALYLFLGKIEMAAPKPLPCVEERLEHFAAQQPANPLANYYYAMAILKRQQPQAPDAESLQHVEALLNKAVALDPRCADAYLQMGILHFARRQTQPAVDDYLKAIDADPQLGEAHYRLAVAYDRLGMADKAKQEFALHDQLEQAQAAQVESQRRALKQFLVVPESRQGTGPVQK